MKKLIRFCCCLAVAAAVFGASAEVLWDWDGSKLTEKLPEGSTETAWEFKLSSSNGALTLAKEGTNPVLDLRAETMPAGVPEIKSFPWAFGTSGAAYCTTVYLPTSLTTINEHAFRAWKKLTSVCLDQTAITKIPSYCFYECSALQTLVIPDTVTSIGAQSFYGCSALKSVNLPAAVTSIGGAAFQNCSSLTEVVLPEALTTIGDSAFYNCTSLVSIGSGLPVGLTSIGSMALRNCPKLTNDVVVGFATRDGEVLATTLGSYLISDSPSIKTVRIGPGVSALPTAIWNNTDPAFVDLCSNISSTPAFPNQYNSLTNLIVRTTDDFALQGMCFHSKTKLREISWGGWFTYTPGFAFANWTALQCRFVIPWHNEKWNEFLAVEGNMAKLWADFSDAEKTAYFVRYGEEAIWPIGYTKAVASGLPQTYIVRNQAADADEFQLLVKSTNPDMATVSVDREPSETTGLYARDTTVTVSLALAPGATFLGWEGDVPEVDRMNTTLTLTMNMRRKLTAVVSIQPEIVPGSLVVSFPNGDSQPRVNFSLTGEEGAVYDATAVVWWKTNGTDWVSCRTKSGLRNGEDASIWLPVAFLAGSALDVRVTVSADSAATRTAEQSGIAVTNPLPQNYGKGGGANVYHVRPGATGDGSGRDWFHAAESLPTDLTQIPAEKSEAWFAGNGGLSGEVYSFAERNFALRGGFTGIECSAADRVPSARTLIDRCDMVDYGLQLPDCFSTDLTIDGFEFSRAKMRGVNQTGSLGRTDGRLEIVNCAFVSNGLATAFGHSDGGRALKLYGSTKDKWGDFLCSNCVFRGNVAVHGDGNKWGGNAPILIYTMRSAAFVDCTFVGNGIDWSREICVETDIKQLSGPAVMLIRNAPVSLTRCAFRANRGFNYLPDDNYPASIVTLEHTQAAWPWSCGVTNCLFVGNESTCAANQMSSSLLRYRDTANAAVADIQNCTFAYNVCSATDYSAGLTVRAGTARVRNSVFYGNRMLNDTVNGCDICVAASGAVVDLDWSLVSANAEKFILAVDGATLSVGENMQYGNPKFVTPLSDVNALLTTVRVGGVDSVAFVPDAETFKKVLAFDVHEKNRSPVIDKGDPAADWSNEPKPNGSRVNMGAYGNTPEAALSSKGLMLLVK